MIRSLIVLGQRFVSAVLYILEGFKPTAVLIVMIRNAAAHGVGDMAAAVGYYGALALLPLLLFTITILSFVLDHEVVVAQVHQIVSQYIPIEMDLIDDNVDAVLRSRTAIGLVSLLALAWSGSNVFGAMTRFMDRAWGVSDPHAFHLVRLKSLLTVSSVSVLLLMSLAASTLVHAAADMSADGWLGWVTGLVNASGQVVLGVTSLLGAILAALMLYRWLPSERTPWRYCVPAAIAAGFSLEVIKNIFLFYLTNFGSFDAVYGSLASVVVLLTWIYVTALVILVVAELGAALREVDARPSRRGFSAL